MAALQAEEDFSSGTGGQMAAAIRHRARRVLSLGGDVETQAKTCRDARCTSVKHGSSVVRAR